jgi:predicted NUDIX family NTP pyrophosphohydrolase
MSEATARPKTVRIRRIVKPTAPPSSTAPLTEMTDEERLAKVKDFYKAYSKNPIENHYNSEGNLFLKGTKTAPDSILLLRGFRPITKEEIEKLEEERLEACRQTENEYEEAVAELREAFASFKAGSGSIEACLSQNKKVQDIEKRLAKTAYPERFLRMEGRPEIRRVIFKDVYETRKMPYDIRSVQRSEISFAKMAGVYLAPGERVAASSRMEGGGAQPSTLHLSADDYKTRYFHPSFPKEFILNNILFASPHQAFEYMRLKHLGNEELAQKLLTTRSSYTISNISKQDMRPITNPQEVWTQILTKFYASSPELLEKLKETGDSNFVFENQAYVNALESVRNRLLESDEPVFASNDETIRQSVISLEEQQKAKKGAIIHNFHRKF